MKKLLLSFATTFVVVAGVNAQACAPDAQYTTQEFILTVLQD